MPLWFQHRRILFLFPACWKHFSGVDGRFSQFSFLHLLRLSHDFSFLLSTLNYIDFLMLNQPCIPSRRPTRHMYHIFYILCLIFFNFIYNFCRHMYHIFYILCLIFFNFIYNFCISVHACVGVCSVWLFATLWTIAGQASLSMGFSRQEYWSGVPFPSPGDFPNPGIKPRCPALAGGFFTTVPCRKPTYVQEGY